MYQISQKLMTHLNNRRIELSNIQKRRVPGYKELRDFIYPFIGRFEGEKPNVYQASMDKQLSGVTNRCIRTLCAGMQAGLTSESRDWFRLLPEDNNLQEDFEAREWCSEVHDRIQRIFSVSNFYAETKKLYAELALYGTGCMFVLQDYDTVVKFKTLTAGSYYLGLGKDDKVDTIYRDLFMTASQIVKEFGKENVPVSVRNIAETTPDKTYEVRHAIEPDESASAKFPFRSVYWLGSDVESVLRVSGFNSFPVMCPRWEVLDGNIYGTGPGHIALGDVKQLQITVRDLNMAIKKQIDPPLIGSNLLRNSALRTHPKGITWADTDDVSGGRMISPIYPVSINLSDLKQLIAETKQDIREAFFEDLFLMMHNSQDKDKTATEINSLEVEKAMVLGPVLEALITEFLTPVIYRTFDIMALDGLLPEAPESISGVELKPEYISILAQAQKLRSVQPIEQTLSYAGNIAGMNQEILDNIDFDAALRKYAENVGAPAGILRGPDAVVALRQQRAEAMQQEQQQQQMMQATEQIPNVVQGAKLLSDIDAEGGSAADALNTLGINGVL